MPTPLPTPSVFAAGRIPGVAAIERALRERDGAYPVGDRYPGSQATARTVRRAAAVRLRLNAIRGVAAACDEISALLALGAPLVEG